MTILNFDTDRNPSVQFCSLKYVPQGSQAELSPDELQILFVALKHECDGLELFVHRNWRHFVHLEHYGYISDLAEDFKQRAVREPEILFKQLTELEVGVIVTDKIEIVTRDQRELMDMLKDFGKI